MTRDDKVIWYEGMFLRAQHFQQQDRHVERLVRESLRGLVPYGWGLRHQKPDRAQLELGSFALSELSGIFPDGTPFSAPQLDGLPDALTLPEDAAGKRIFLAIPERRADDAEFGGAEGEDGRVSRYDSVEAEVFDAIRGTAGAAAISLGRLKLRYLLEGTGSTGFVLLPVARVQEMRSDRKCVLDDSFIPPLMNVGASPVLSGVITEITGLLRHRGEAISGRLGAGGARGVSDVADFMMLQAINRSEPVLAHLARTAALHPERLFTALASLAGELAGFTASNRRAPEFPAYRHDDLTASFRPIVAAIRQSLSAVLETPAVQIALTDRGHGVRVGVIPDRSLIASAGFVLAVRADMPQEEIRTAFPRLVKIGPVEQIRELVNVALPGIRIRPLPVAPRQIPFHSTAVYFELERGTTIWKALAGSGGIAVHVAGDFRDLSVDLWAIRG